MRFGVYTFVETRRDPETGRAIDVARSFADLLEEAALADRVGLDVFGVGEHHRADYAVSAPAVALAAIAARTANIRLTSAVTVLSSDDPVRVYQAFATLDQISNGRAEIMVGRGSFIKSFPLFGYSLDDYDQLFADKLQLLLKIRAGERVVWSGDGRAPLTGQGVYPAPCRRSCRSGWRSAARRNRWCAPRRSACRSPWRSSAASRSASPRSPASIARPASGRASTRRGWRSGSTATASSPTVRRPRRTRSFPRYAEVMTRVGRERGWPPTTRAQFDAARALRGALAVGGPDEVIEKSSLQHAIFGHQRYLMQMRLGDAPHEAVMRSIELLGTRVAPAVRKEIARREKGGAGA